MTDKEIIEKWKQGLSKNKLALIYKRQYNQQMRIMKSEIVNRHKGKFITSYEALSYIERIIYKYLKEK